MPNRIIKESICTSENIDALTEFQEIFFYRLMVNCDDYGRFDARTKLISSRLFPLKSVTIDMVEDALTALQKNDLIFLYEVGGHPYLQMKTWEKHQQIRANKSKYPSPDDCQIQSDDANGNQLISDDIKNPRNRIRNTLLDNRESLSSSDNALIADADAHRIQSEQNRVLDAATDAGFKLTNNVIASLTALYADFGLEKMLEGIKSCSEHGVVNMAYLRAVLKGEPKKEKPKVIAQAYGQRDYSGIQDELEAQQDREMEEWMKRQSG